MSFYFQNMANRKWEVNITNIFVGKKEVNGNMTDLA